jgi:hypothetical protein
MRAVTELESRADSGGGERDQDMRGRDVSGEPHHTDRHAPQHTPNSLVGAAAMTGATGRTGSTGREIA